MPSAHTSSARLTMNESIQDLEGQRVATIASSIAQPVDIDDRLWSELDSLTGGSAALCYQCGVCTASCPWGQVKEGGFSVRALLRCAQLGLDAVQEELWLCTACGQCEALCPRGVHIGEVIRGIRQLAWQERLVPPGLPTMMWSLHRNNNPWDQPPSARAAWALNQGVPYFDRQQHEILLYVGCTVAYDRRSQSIARALVSVLRACGVAFGYLADDEPCCGESALSLGHRPFFEALIGAAFDSFSRHRATQVVTISPHCFDAFTRHTPTENDRIEFLHYPQYLARLAHQGRLATRRLSSRRVTFHDPCYLARLHRDRSSARAVLGALTGLEFEEMRHHGRETICCGGGGGRMWLETAPDERFADLRIAEAVELEADCIITACPFCLTCLEDSVKSKKRHDLRVMDLAELVLQAMAPEGQ